MAAVTIEPMVIAVGDRTVRRLTVEEAMSLVGMLPDAERLELLHGVLLEKPVKGEPHAEIQERLAIWLGPLQIARELKVRVDSSFAPPDPYSLPEPDVMVFEPHGTRPPSSALLLIEVAVSSLRTDLDVKAPLYASAGVDEYWVVDVTAERIVVHTEPEHDGYRSRRTVDSGELAPISVPVAALDVTALFA